jgi:riboflavin kinase/FMN adenylyltransferase
MTVVEFPRPVDWKNAVVAIGNFDGVHAGHRALLTRAREMAAGRPLVALTFEPHPRMVLRPEQPLRRLMTAAEKLAALTEWVDGVAVVPFNAEVAKWAPEEFITRALVDWLGAGAVVVGENFRFGRGAAGDVAMLRAQPAFATEVVALVRENGVAVSSSGLRKLLEDKPNQG